MYRYALGLKEEEVREQLLGMVGEVIQWCACHLPGGGRGGGEGKENIQLRCVQPMNSCAHALVHDGHYCWEYSHTPLPIIIKIFMLCL